MDTAQDICDVSKDDMTVFREQVLHDDIYRSDDLSNG